MLFMESAKWLIVIVENGHEKGVGSLPLKWEVTMGKKTGISWTGWTWNCLVGCSILSPGCKNCYAMKQAYELATFRNSGKYAGLTELVNGKPVWNGVVRIHDKALREPFRQKTPSMVFVNSMSDLFHESLGDEDIFKIIDIMFEANWHTYQVLTKRTAKMAAVLERYCASRGVALPAHIWWGSTVEDQKRAEERVPVLASIPAPVRFISAEPLLGPLDLGKFPKIEWVIVGGESAGKEGDPEDVRQFDVNWALDIADYCDNNGVALHVKQMGSNPIGVKVTHYKGADMSEWPENLRVQDYPVAMAV